MQCIILAGGLGSRLSEETQVKPKPMVEIGSKPILWHIMKIFSSHGINDFIICLGYKGYIIKEYFANYFMHNSNITFDMKANKTIIHENHTEPWTVTLVDTGEHSQTGGRLKRVAPYIKGDFLFTYGDGVADINIRQLIRFHHQHGLKATVTAVQPPGRFGSMELGECDIVTRFQEKPKGENGWINGGFFVLSPDVVDTIENDLVYWEREPLKHLAATSQLAAFKHNGFWHPMDTLRDKNHLEYLWESGQAPWRKWCG